MPRDYSLQQQKPTAHQRIPKYEASDNWIRTYLHHGQIAHIASLWDDQPFITPSTYFYDETGHRLIFHSNITGRLRANLERNPRVCVEVSELGKLLPSNVALEFSLQYRSVMVFGTAHIIEDREEKRTVLHQLIEKYFRDMQLDADYRPATDEELKRTSVYEIKIESWSGKDHWKEKADQSDEWPPLDKKWFAEIK
jgi:nitroimidazol reductase NimA-like FMN-containing flavoprotein (pyridoxamine 5'-phosphate oxidase superfamily)